MAAKEKTSAESADKTEPVSQPKAKSEFKQTEPVYSSVELSANANILFGVRTECAVAALKTAGITECTVSKAKGIVQSFMKKEVK